MRTSVDADDPGYANWSKHPRMRVFLDGIERNGVFTADEEARLIVMAVRDESGNLRLNADRTEVLRETLYGHVRLERME